MRFSSLALVVVLISGCVGDPMLEGEEDIPPPNNDPQLGCAESCHGSQSSNAPPKGLEGETATTDRAVGAHQQHLDASSDWHRKLQCADCHAVPAEVGSPGHIDGDGIAELTFGTIAGANASFNGSSCTTDCHGSTQLGGSSPEPLWTMVDGTQAACGSCHGAPPPSPARR